jgi:hypothetical protein
MNSINAIPAVVAAAPGLTTHLDLPLVGAPSLFRPASDRGLVMGPSAAKAGQCLLDNVGRGSLVSVGRMSGRGMDERAG